MRSLRWRVFAMVLASTVLAPVAGGPVAAPAAAPPAIEIHGEHPRLVVGGYRGASRAELRDTCAAPEARGACDEIGGRHLLDDAMRFLLDGDAGAADRARRALLDGVACGNGYETTPAGGHAIAYDWVWETLSPGERSAIEASLAACGERIARSLEGNPAHLWHGFTSQAAALALVALAIDDDPRRADLLAAAEANFRRRSLEAWAVVGGAWPEGFNYARSHFFSGDPPYQYVLDALRAWDSAVARDDPDHASLFETIAAEEGDWLRGFAYHLVYDTLPPYGAAGRRTLARAGDLPTGQAHPHKQYRPFVDAIARIYGDGVLRAWGEALEGDWDFVGGTGTYHPIHRYQLPVALPVGVPPAAPDGLPLGRAWGERDLGDVTLRSGWGDDAAIVGYRAGKWFTGHQHMDQGHIDLWRSGPLAVDAGVYANWGSEHREAYYIRSVAHNTLLIHRRGEDFDEHPSLDLDVNDGGQRIHTYNAHSCAQCIQSVEEWRGHVGAGMHLEAGVLEAFEEGGRYALVESDLTGAYNSTRYATGDNPAKVALVQRDLVYVRPALVLVADRVRTTPGTEAPRFVLHLPARPAPLGAAWRVVAGTPTDGILEATTRGITMDNGTGGHLWVRTLVPAAPRMRAIGGPGHRYWVDGANRLGGAEGLEGPPAEPGLWRLEAGPADAGPFDAPTDTLLVHALWLGTAAEGPAGEAAADTALVPVEVDPASPEPIVAIRAPSGSPGGGPTVIVLSGAVPRAPVEYAVLEAATDARFTLLATGLAPGRAYWLALDGERLAAARASGDGVLEVGGLPAGRLALAACPAPAEAGPGWRTVCEGPAATPGVRATSTPPPVSPTAAPTGRPTRPSAPHGVLVPWSRAGR